MLHGRGISLAWRVGRLSAERKAATSALPSRKFSALSASRRPRTNPSLTYGPHLSSATRRPQLLIASAAFGQARHNSSSTEPHHANVPLNPLTSPADYTGEELSESIDVLASVDVKEPWYPGYLAEHLGGFGWGPTSTVQWLLEHLHIYTGTSIGITIMMAAIAVRVGIFPLIIRASDTGARMRAMAPEMKLLNAKMKEAIAEKDQMEMAKQQRIASRLRKQHGVVLKRMAYPLIQVPIGFGMWRLLRNMAFLPIPGMSSAGLLWFPNLCIPDPFFILPFCIGGLQHLSFRLGGDTGTQNQQTETMRKVLMYGLPGMSLLVTMWAPAAIQLSFTTSAFMAVVGNVALRNPTTRSLFGITPLPKTQPAPTPKVVDTTGKIIGAATATTPEQPLTPIRKVKNWLGDLTVNKLVKRAEKAQADVGDSMFGPTSPLASILPARKGTPEKKKADFEAALKAREERRTTQVLKKEKADFQQFRAQRQKKASR